jgi:hypothetical protein
MPMSTGLTSRLSDVAKRPDSAGTPAAGGSPGASSLDQAGLKLSARARGWVERLFPPALARYAAGFAVGIAATLAWQWYGDPARAAVAGWSPYLGWLAPAPAGASAERHKATSLALAAVRQSVDKLAAEISRQEAQAASDRTASERTASAAPSRRGSRH